MQSHSPRERRAEQGPGHITEAKISKGTSIFEGRVSDTLSKSYFPKEIIQQTARNGSGIFETWLVNDCL